MSDIFQEIDEALKREKAEKWWQENGKTVIAGCVLAVLVTGITTFGLRWAEKNRAQDTTALIEALSQNTIEPLLNVAENTSGGIATLARFHAAHTAFDKGDKAQGFEILTALSTDKKTDKLYRDYAGLLLVLKKMDDTTADKQVLLETLGPLTADKNPWRFSAREAQAVLLFETGKKEEALSVVEALALDASAPQDVSLRAKKIARVMKNL